MEPGNRELLGDVVSLIIAWSPSVSSAPAKQSRKIMK